MKKLFFELKLGLLGSLSNDTAGFSAKKLTGFAITVCVIIAHIKWFNMKDFTQLTTVLTIDYTFIATLFGINVVDKMKNPTDSSKAPGTDAK